MVLPTDRQYFINHGMVRENCGNAKLYDCVDCGKKAYEWSQIHDADGSKDEHFQPRCRSCHQYYDPPKSKPCEVGCTCGRHSNGQYDRTPCKPGCNCGKHRGNGSRKCKPGCTCRRHLNGRVKVND